MRFDRTVLIVAENLFCAGTYKKVLDSVAAPALAKANIYYNTLVDRITSRRQPKDMVQVHEANRNKLEFDEVVVTTPLGWLKRHLDAFEPRLPMRLSQAIESIGYGCLEKVPVNHFGQSNWWANISGLHYVSRSVLALSRRRRSQGARLRTVAFSRLCTQHES